MPEVGSQMLSTYENHSRLLLDNGPVRRGGLAIVPEVSTSKVSRFKYLTPFPLSLTGTMTL